MALYTQEHMPQIRRSHLPGLPQDIWQEIFKCGRHFHDPFERMKFTLLISSVSATWRFFVIQTSLLWSTIAVNHVVTRRLTTPEGQMGAQSEHFDLVNLFLERSRRSSLDVYVKLTTSNRDKMSTSNVFHHPPPALRGDSKSTVSDLAFVLAPHAPRFRRFHVLSTRYCPVKELLSSLPQVAMPCLQELHIDRVQRTHTQLHSDCPRACHDTMAFLNIQDITKQSAAEYFQDNFPALKSVALSAMPLLLPLFTPRYLTSLKLTLPQFDFVTELKDLLAANASSLKTSALWSPIL
ncbi:hypothetical protein BDZ97DRAFT_1373379 [Flammula alnicola]|nr:hypothetical protein BDZ97DRAFT_1373379 [Flammula alnicola]